MNILITGACWTDTDGYTDRQQADIVSLLLFFRNKKSRVKTKPRLQDFNLRTVKLTTHRLLNIVHITMNRKTYNFQITWKRIFIQNLIVVQLV
jgi:hypothetical protein